MSSKGTSGTLKLVKLSELSRPGGETGRHAGLKILWAARPVRVQLPPGARSDLMVAFFMPFFVYIIYSPSLQHSEHLQLVLLIRPKARLPVFFISSFSL